MYGDSSSSSSKEIKRDTRLAAMKVAIIKESPMPAATSAPSPATDINQQALPDSSNKTKQAQPTATQEKKLPESNRPSPPTQPKDIGAIEAPSKFLSPELLEQTARPFNDVWLDPSRLPPKQVYSVSVQVFVNSSGVVEQFKILNTNLPPESIDSVFAIFHETPFTPGIVKGEAQDSYVNLELEIDTFPLDLPRFPLINPPIR